MENDITDIGKVAITPQKDYKENATYEWLDVVTYDGASYMCISEDGCTGIIPTNTEYWQLLADKGRFTEEDKETFKQAVVEESKTTINEHTETKKTEIDNYTTEQKTSLKNELDTYEEEKETELNTHKATLETEMTNTKDNLVQEIETAQNGFDTNVEEKTNTFNSNVETKTTEFNNNSNAKTEEFNNNSTEKINAFNSNAEEKIAEYDAHAESVLTETGDLFNALDTEKASGTELYIEDAKPCRVINAGIGGMYKQETTRGINLINTNEQLNNTINGITKKNNKDGSLTLTGTATAEARIQLRTGTLEEGKYTYKCFGNKTDCVTNIYYIGNVTGESTRIFTVSANSTNNYVFMYIIPEGTAINVTIKPMLVHSEYTVDTFPDFEPFTGMLASPNPDYPKEIEQIKEVKYCGTAKNLINFNEISGNANNFEYSVNGTYININGTPSGTYATSNRMRCHIKKKEVVTIKITSAKSGTYRLWIKNKENKIVINSIICNASASGIKTITVKDNVETVQLVIENLTAGTVYTDTITIQIEKGQNATETEEYKNQTINIDLKGNKLCAVSDTIKDKLLIDRNGNVALQKNVNYSTFLAFNSVNGSFTKSTQFILNISNCVKNVVQDSFNALSNCMLKNTVDSGMGYYGTTTSGNVRITVSNDLLGITQEDTTSTKLNAAKTFLQNLQQTPEIYYPAEVPELIDLGQLTELPKTFDGINNIWAETNLGNTEIEIEYVQDVKKLLEKQAEQQNARLDNIEALLSTTETSALLLDNMQTDLEKEVK